MSSIANVRSPLFINPALGTVNTYTRAEFEVRVWTGNSIKPVSPTYTLTKYNTSGDNLFPLELSELVRDYLYTDYFTEAVDAVWVRYDAEYFTAAEPTTPSAFGGKTWLAFDGYGYFEEGINPREAVNPATASFTPQLLQDNTTVYFIKGEDIKIPIFAESLATISYVIGGVSSTIVISDDGDSNQKIQYVNITGTENLNDGDTITITNGVFSNVTTITLREICELKYVPYRVVFYNKYGALQDLWFNKKSVENINVTSSNYKRNIIEFNTSVPTADYSIYKHANRRFDVVANETIQLSTGYVVEALNEPIKQLLMSESVWIDDGTNVYPVNVNTQSLQMKKGVNEKLIAYTLDFNFAFDKIQNIR